MTLELLRKFCDHDRLDIAEPWSSGHYTLASDGVLLIRVQLMFAVPGRDNAPSAEKIESLPWAASFKDTQFAPLPELVLLGDCPTCGATRRGYKGWVRIFNRIANGKYLEKLSLLPGVQIDSRAVDDANLPFAIRFDGGDGLLTPMHLPREDYRH